MQACVEGGPLLALAFGCYRSTPPGYYRFADSSWRLSAKGARALPPPLGHALRLSASYLFLFFRSIHSTEARSLHIRQRRPPHSKGRQLGAHRNAKSHDEHCCLQRREPVDELERRRAPATTEIKNAVKVSSTGMAFGDFRCTGKCSLTCCR